MAKPSYEQLIAYAAGSLDVETAAMVAHHLQEDDRASRTVAMYRLTQRLAASDDGASPSAEAMARAKAVFKAAPAAGARRPSWLEAVDRLVATILFDSRLQPLAVRSAATCDRIDLTAEVGGIEIDVQAERTGDADQLGGEAAASWQIMGQISGIRPPQPIEVALVNESGAAVGVTVDERGGFNVKIESGRYELLVRLAEGVVHVAQLDLV